MQINADFSQRAAVHVSRLPWVKSPVVGIERRMLDRVGGEVARATSIVRYAPGSQFSPHVHGGGEEFLVLDGTFEDEHGAFGAGHYMRNPPTSSHTPGSSAGCTIFVKLWQFAPEDRTQVRINTDSLPWHRMAETGEVKHLYHDQREHVALRRYEAGAPLIAEEPGGIELLVLEGSFVEGGETFATQSWLRLPSGGRLGAVAGPHGTMVWMKTGHLAHPALWPEPGAG